MVFLFFWGDSSAWCLEIVKFKKSPYSLPVWTVTNQVPLSDCLPFNDGFILRSVPTRFVRIFSGFNQGGFSEFQRRGNGFQLRSFN